MKNNSRSATFAEAFRHIQRAQESLDVAGGLLFSLDAMCLASLTLHYASRLAVLESQLLPHIKHEHERATHTPTPTAGC